MGAMEDRLRRAILWFAWTLICVGLGYAWRMYHASL
jgi:hypothetical protein